MTEAQIKILVTKIDLCCTKSVTKRQIKRNDGKEENAVVYNLDG